MYKISQTIQETCNKLGIKYFSPYYEEIEQYKQDITTLADKYSQLKQMCSELLELAERYKDLPEIYKDLLSNVQKLDKIDHRLIYDANKILRRKQNEVIMLETNDVVSVMANGMKMYKIKGNNDSLYQTKEAAEKALAELRETGFKTRRAYRNFVTGGHC